MSRYYGWRPSPKDERDWPLSRLGLVQGVFGRPDSVDYSHMIDKIVDQVGPSCVGEGTARGVHVRRMIEGAVADLPDALFIYALARAYEVGPDGPLPNDGAFIRNALQVINDCGVAPRGTCSPDDILQRPNWRAMQLAADSRQLEYARLLSADEARSALWSGFPVVIGGDVDQAYCDRGPSDPPWNGVAGTVLGGHCRCLVGYEPGALLEVNSWGTNWAQGGFSWLTDSVVDSSELWAVKMVTA